MAKKAYSVQLSRDVHEAIAGVARKHRTSMAAVTNDFLSYVLANYMDNRTITRKALPSFSDDVWCDYSF